MTPKGNYHLYTIIYSQNLIATLTLCERSNLIPLLRIGSCFQIATKHLHTQRGFADFFAMTGCAYTLGSNIMLSL